MKARLLEDGGAGASDAEHFFRSPPFLEAEGVTHTLALEDVLHLPVIVRGIGTGERRDAISPYGYPGANELPSDPRDPWEIEWSATGLVSVFLRDRVGERTCLADGTLRNHVHVAEGTGGIRKRLREQVRRNERRGWRVDIARGGEIPGEALADFRRAYAETMTRTGAAARYFFPAEYFERALSGRCSRLLTASRDEGKASAGAIAVVSDGYLHYYLGGTADEALEDSPMKNLFAAMIELGDELGLPVSLGGGVEPGDSLDDFKRGFATAQAPWYTHEVVCDAPAYEELAAGAGDAPGGFFPVYRA